MNLYRFLEDSAKKYPDKTAVRTEEEEITFGQLDVQCRRLANGLRDFGINPKDRCVIMIPNSIQYITVYYALAMMGSIIIPINYLYRKNELKSILSDCEPKAFIGAAPYLEAVHQVFNELEKPHIRIAYGKSNDSDFKMLRDIYSSNKNFSVYPAHEEDTVNILYTSGTTGEPKGVMLTHKNMSSTARIVSEMRGSIKPETLVIGVLPLFHVYGVTSILNASMYLGLTIALFERFDAQKVIALIENEKVTMLFSVPTMINRLIQLATKKPLERSSLKYCISGAASLPIEFLNRFEDLFSVKVYEGYGLTEGMICIENPYADLTKPGSTGLPIPEFSARIVNKEGRDVPPGEVGELIIKGPGVMKGYFKRREETNKIIKDGWLYTGDMASKDEDGYIFIVDRKKDLIIRGGYNIYPREIEEVLYTIPDVLEASVFGMAHEDLGEEVAAVVYLKEGSNLTAEKIKDYVREQVAPYKYPRIINIAKGPLPKTGSGKILKKEVRKLFAA